MACHGVLKQLLGGGDTHFWQAAVKHVQRVEFQARSTLHFHPTVWVLPKGRARTRTHSMQSYESTRCLVNAGSSEEEPQVRSQAAHNRDLTTRGHERAKPKRAQDLRRAHQEVHEACADYKRSAPQGPTRMACLL